MQISLDTNHGQYIIRSYEPGEIKINDETLHCSVIVTMDQLIATWPPQNFAELTITHLQTLADLKPEVVILGTGTKLTFPKPELLDVFYKNKIGVEVMDTHAACRTYNVLTSEGRNVAAGLLIR